MKKITHLLALSKVMELTCKKKSVFLRIIMCLQSFIITEKFKRIAFNPEQIKKSLGAHRKNRKKKIELN